jgi:hypothetical protein
VLAQHGSATYLAGQQGRSRSPTSHELALIIQLQDVFASIGVANNIVSCPLPASYRTEADIQDLPQITVIGSQSSGKSSVLEVSQSARLG